MPKPRNYIYISERKVNMLFPQLPADFVASFERSQAKDDLYHKVAVVSAYIEENCEVGTVEAPRAYFKGTISSRCLVTESQVFFGTKLGKKGGRRPPNPYVGLSGSLVHMLNPVFEELRREQYEVMPALRKRLERAKAQYLHLNSNTATFHGYLTSIPTNESRASKRKGGGGFPSLRGSFSGTREFFTVWGLALAPLVLAVASWWLLGYWAIIPIVLAIAWAALYVTFIVAALAFASGLNYAGPTLECSVKRVVEGMYGPAEVYDFLAVTITRGKCEGEGVLLGTPVYIALGDYRPV